MIAGSNAAGALADLRDALAGALIVSCQPVPGGPLDRTSVIVAFAQAALDGGARGLRIEGAANVAAVVEAVRVPVIGLIKRDLETSAVRITPELADIDALARVGAPIIAFDATARARPSPVAALVARIHAHGRVALADVATMAEGMAASAAGADLVATTLAGYAGPGPEPSEPDLALVAALAAKGLTVIAEGNIRTPQQAAAARAAGAHAVVVGSAITRPEHITQWFVTALTGPIAGQRQNREASRS